MDNAWPLMIPIVAIAGGFFLAGMGIYAGIRKREFEHRERLAMIEKGLTPPGAPPASPTAGSLPTHGDVWGYLHETRAARARRGGFILIAIGIGVGFLITMSDGHLGGEAIGIGGFLIILGAAIFLTSFFGNTDSSASNTAGNPSRR